MFDIIFTFSKLTSILYVSQFMCNRQAHQELIKSILRKHLKFENMYMVDSQIFKHGHCLINFQYIHKFFLFFIFIKNYF